MSEHVELQYVAGSTVHSENQTIGRFWIIPLQSDIYRILLSKSDLADAMEIYRFDKHYIMLREDTGLSYRG